MNLKQGSTTRSLPMGGAKSALRATLDLHSKAGGHRFHNAEAHHHWEKLQGIFRAGVALREMGHTNHPITPIMPSAASESRHRASESSVPRSTPGMVHDIRRQMTTAGAVEDTETLMEISGDVLAEAVEKEKKYKQRRSSNVSTG